MIDETVPSLELPSQYYRLKNCADGFVHWEGVNVQRRLLLLHTLPLPIVLKAMASGVAPVNAPCFRCNGTGVTHSIISVFCDDFDIQSTVHRDIFL